MNMIFSNSLFLDLGLTLTLCFQHFAAERSKVTSGLCNDLFKGVRELLDRVDLVDERGSDEEEDHGADVQHEEHAIKGDGD